MPGGAAKIDVVDRDYWDGLIAPLIKRHEHIEFVGEIGDSEKARFLGEAQALLFPIDWPEPFGLVMIEAMACGTPVIAWNCGSVPEIIDDGTTGFVVDDVAGAVNAVRRLAMIDRNKVRSVFERRFTVERMTADYLSVYRRLTGVRRNVQRLERPDGDGAPVRLRRGCGALDRDAGAGCGGPAQDDAARGVARAARDASGVSVTALRTSPTAPLSKSISVA